MCTNDIFSGGVSSMAFWNAQSWLSSVVGTEFTGAVITQLRPELWPEGRISVCAALCTTQDCPVYYK